MGRAGVRLGNLFHVKHKIKMADGGPTAPQLSLQPQHHMQYPLLLPCNHSTSHTISCPPVQPGPRPQLNWGHCKPEFAGKPDEDAEAHLHRTNNWMDSHEFLEGVKVQRFCLTLVGEAKLWYESLRPIGLDWNGLETQFRQQYSKIGNTREQPFHVWRSFAFDENAETLDAYVMDIRQVAALLGYGKPQDLEVFKNTLPSRL